MKKNMIVFIAIFLVAQNYAATRYVRIGGVQLDNNFLTWETAASNIQAAVDISVFGDEIIVTNGTYIPDDTDGFYISRGIKLKSVNGSASTIIDGANTKRCLRIDNADAIADGFTIRNGGKNGGNGGGVLCKKGLVKNCLIIDNNVNSANGGGIYLNNNGIAENCIIKNNNASSQGGGVYLDNGGVLRNCLITANSANNGGGISFDTTGTVQNCTIVKNTAGTQGGGVYSLSGGRLINSIIYLNTGSSGSNLYNIAALASLSFCYSAPILPGNSNLSLPPTFLSESDNRFQQNCGSSCINAGTNMSWMSAVLDLDYNTRIFDGVADVGAYEYIPPFINITNENLLVSFDFNKIIIIGTNNNNVVGEMHLINYSNSFAKPLQASQSWAASNVMINVGFNNIEVNGTNRYGIFTNDFIIVERGDVGTGLPFINITNDNKLVSYDKNEVTIGGTNNIHVMGAMWWTNSLTGQNGELDSAVSWKISNIVLVVGINEILVYGTNYWNKFTNDFITIERGGIGTGTPFVDITNDISQVKTSVSKVTIAGTNNIHVVALRWENINNGSNGSVSVTGIATTSSSWTIPDVSLGFGNNEIIVTASNYWNVITTDSIFILRKFDTNNTGVLCLWPELIGHQQTGTVEFVSPVDSSWTLLAGSNEVATGTCTVGWNLVEFFAGNLPVQDENSSNFLQLAVGGGLEFNAGCITVVKDNLKTNPDEFVKDLDDDLIYVKYIPKANGEIRAEGRTLFIEDGNAKDKLIIKVKPAKGTGDGVCRISGIICNGDLGKIKIPGTLDRLIVNGSLKKLILKGGTLGHNCKTKLHNVRFRSDAGKSLIKTVAVKNKLDKKFIPANVFANILCGELNDDGTIEPEILKTISIAGGNLGLENVRKKLDAKAVGNLIVKQKKDVNGDIIDYSFYLTGEEKQGSGMSFKKIMANNILDSNSSNSYFVCGYDSDIKTNSFPYDVSGNTWTNHIVKYNFGKIIVKGSELNGTFVIKDWAPKKGKAKQVKAKGAGTDDASWIVNQEIDED